MKIWGLNPSPRNHLGWNSRLYIEIKGPWITDYVCLLFRLTSPSNPPGRIFTRKFVEGRSVSTPWECRDIWVQQNFHYVGFCDRSGSSFSGLESTRPLMGPYLDSFQDYERSFGLLCWVFTLPKSRGVPFVTSRFLPSLLTRSFF